MKNQILIIDDDLENCKRIKYHLQNGKTDVYYSTSILDGLKQLLTQTYMLLIIDVALFDANGILLLKEIRNLSPLPILAMSAKASMREKATAINGGADDYLSKPFALEDCFLRAQALIRRYTEFNHDLQPAYTIVSCDSLQIDPVRRTSYFAGKPLSLTKTEFDMLYLLAKNPDRVFTYEQIYGHVWNEAFFGSVNNIASHISRIRKKEPSLDIESVHDIGYRLNKKLAPISKN